MMGEALGMVGISTYRWRGVRMQAHARTKNHVF